jgi:hypothetical protein
MNDWRSKLTEQLLGPAGRFDAARPNSGAALEIVFGHARSELTYVLELGRTHNLPVSGSVTGDDIWLRVGATSLRFHFSRRAGVIVASVIDREDVQLRYDPEQRAVVTPDGVVVDPAGFVREAIDATVTAWRSSGRPGVSISTLAPDRSPLPTLPDSSEVLPKS